jgi:hypothetical protein
MSSNGGFIMGYRSEVKCIIYGSPEVLDSFIAKHALQNNAFLSEMKDHITYGMMERIEYMPNGERRPYKNKVMDFHGNQFKWYDEFDDVQGLNRMMDDINENYKDTLDFEFVRVGEENKDIETESSINSYGYIYPSTTIVNDYSMEEIPNEND